MKIFTKSFESKAFPYKINLTIILGGFVKWSIGIFTVLLISDILEWKIISEEIGQLINYLPKLFSATIILIIGIYIARTVQNFFNITA